MKKLLILLLSCAPLSAHDFWIEPSTFRPAAGTTLSASLRVGMDFLGDPVPRSTALMDSFVIRDAAGTRDMIGFENRDPAGLVRVDNEQSVIGYRSKASMLEQTPEKFAQFLREEGITGVTPNGPHRERFYRFAKTILGSYASSKPFGWRFEIVPEAKAWRVMFENKPLAGALVTAIARDDEARVSARTDKQGRVTLNLPHNGVWLVKTTHLIAAPAGSGAEWESLWASVTFER